MLNLDGAIIIAIRAMAPYFNHHAFCTTLVKTIGSSIRRFYFHMYQEKGELTVSNSLIPTLIVRLPSNHPDHPTRSGRPTTGVWSPPPRPAPCACTTLARARRSCSFWCATCGKSASCAAGATTGAMDHPSRTVLIRYRRRGICWPLVRIASCATLRTTIRCTRRRRRPRAHRPPPNSPRSCRLKPQPPAPHSRPRRVSRPAMAVGK